MAAFEAKIKGIAEVKRALYVYNAKLGERVTRVALRQGANLMLKQVRAAAPVKTGRLKRAIKIKNSKINRINKNGKVGLFLTISPGKSRKDLKGAWYGQFIEHGYNTGTWRNGEKYLEEGGSKFKVFRDLGKQYNKSGGRIQTAKQLRYHKRGGGVAIPGKHFLRDTFNATKQAALETIIDASEIAANRIAKELNLK